MLSWLGLGLSAGAPLAFFAWLYLANAARTSRHPVVVSAICGLGVAVTMAANWRYGTASGVVHLWAGLSLLGWLVYLRWYSVFSPRKNLTLGALLPEFTLKNLRGDAVSSNAFRGKYHVLVFYRGNWCPLCSAQIRELAAYYRDLQALDAEVVLISSQPQSHTRKLAKKYHAPMQFLRDPDNSAAKQLGIVHRFGTPMGMQALGYGNDTVMPTVIITGPDGSILFADETDNYRVRPEPDLFLQIIKGA